MGQNFFLDKLYYLIDNTEIVYKVSFKPRNPSFILGIISLSDK